MTTELLNNRYRILQTLSSGGFGDTFLATDLHMPSQRRCVIKRLKPINNDPKMQEWVEDRFQREAAILEQLGEGNRQIPKLYAYFPEQGYFYLVQEWIQGVTLTEKLQQQGVLRADEVRSILISLLRVLDYIHGLGIIHRDIKPDNIILCRQDHELPVLIDFGAVKQAMTTIVNTVAIGTPGYIPSEQAVGRPIYASDLYSLGLTAIYLLSGKTPQELPTDSHNGEFLWQQDIRDLDSNLSKALDKATRFDLGSRFSSAKEMLAALQSQPLTAATVAVNSPTTLSEENSSTPLTVNRWGKFSLPLLIVTGVSLGTVAALILFSLQERSPQKQAISPTPTSSPTPTPEISPSPIEPSATPTPEISPSPIEPSATPTPEISPSPIEPSATPTPEISPSPIEPSATPTPEISPSPIEPSATPTPEISPSPIEPSPTPTPEISPSPIKPSPTPTPEISPSPIEPSATPTPEISPSPIEPSPTPTPEISPSPIEPSATPIPEISPSPIEPSPTPSPNQGEAKRISVPIFVTGTAEQEILTALGKPTSKSKGYWPNTTALLYQDLVPNEVDLGYLVDSNTGLLRQTEVTFTQSAGLETMQQTLDGLLENQTPAVAKQGLERIYNREINWVSFNVGQLKGSIERQSDTDQIYIAIWEADFHL